MLSRDFISIFFEFVPVVDFECKIRKFCLEFLLTYPCLVEEMKNKFLRVGELFSYGREKGCLSISEFNY